jgi:hypothetical protein
MSDQDTEWIGAGELPKVLQEELRAIGRPCVFVAREADAAILAAARSQLEGVLAARRRRVRRRWLAAAAALVLGIGYGAFWMAHPPAAGLAGEDLNHDGRVDILDAFQLARTLKQPNGPRAGLPDVNGDGVVNDQDVEALAAKAVRLDGRHG